MQTMDEEETHGDTYWGLCPKCNRPSNGFRHINRHHYAVCTPCKMAWYVGSNLFSAWREMTAEQFAEDLAFLSTCQVVDETRIQRPKGTQAA